MGDCPAGGVLSAEAAAAAAARLVFEGRGGEEEGRRVLSKDFILPFSILPLRFLAELVSLPTIVWYRTVKSNTLSSALVLPSAIKNRDRRYQKMLQRSCTAIPKKAVSARPLVNTCVFNGRACWYEDRRSRWGFYSGSLGPSRA